MFFTDEDDAVGECIDHGMKGNKFGYSLTWVGDKQQYRHRLVCAEKMGITVHDIPKGSVVRHLCGNPRCINPDHLKVGTHTENRYDQMRHTGKGFGETWWSAVLTEKQVREIKFENNHMTSKELSKIYNVTARHIRDIRAGNRWKHVKLEDSKESVKNEKLQDCS